MSISPVIAPLLAALVVYIAIGLVVGRKTAGIGDLLPLSASRRARIETTSEFTSSTVATTISLATVIMAFFSLARYLGLWLLWTVVTTSAGLLVVRLFARRIWQRLSRYDHRPTLHEFLGGEFDSKILLGVGAVCTSGGFLGAFAVELTVGSKFFTALVPDAPAVAVVAVLSFAAFLYTAVGGFRAVIVTDRIQMFSIWLLLLSLPVFYAYYILTHGGWAVNFGRIPAGVLDFSARPGLAAFLLGIFAINVPSFLSDMSIWQRMAGARREETVTGGLGKSAFNAAVTWGAFALLACFVFMVVSPRDAQNPLLSLLNQIASTGGALAGVVLFISVLGLYGAMLSTASTQLIAVSHTMYADLFVRLRGRSISERLDSRREMNLSRLILVVTALVAILLVQLLAKAGFSVVDLIFAVYGSQLGLCPLVVSALVFGRNRLRILSFWATLALSLGFVSGWGSAVYGRFTGNTNLVFLAPAWSLLVSTLLLVTGITWERLAGRWPAGINEILVTSILKARLRGLYRLVPAAAPARLVCLKDKCAKCCKVIGTPVVTPREAGRIGRDLLMAEGGAVFVRSEEGKCVLLKDGLCSIYPGRPAGCREYPWYNIDGELYYDRGCPGVQYDRDERPPVGEIQNFENFLPNCPRLVIGLIKKVCVKKKKEAG
jgi:sodium/pantothenate symporter